jgi:hypothetical protein
MGKAECVRAVAVAVAVAVADSWDEAQLLQRGVGVSNDLGKHGADKTLPSCPAARVVGPECHVGPRIAGNVRRDVSWDGCRLGLCSMIAFACLCTYHGLALS